MRRKLKPLPDKLTTRIRSRFLWFPKVIERELRWLEKATWEEVYYCGWTPDKWIDK